MDSATSHLDDRPRDQDKGWAGRSVPVLGAARLGLGLGMLAAPSLLTRWLRPDDADGGRWAWAVRMVGARELALGAGCLRAWGRGGDMTGWVAAQATADAGDALASLLAVRRGDVDRGRGRLLALSALSGVVAEAAMVARLRRDA
ncbi:MAG: hypothetical protein ACTHQ3_03480 [Motilibacteraceae bacterium]